MMYFLRPGRQLLLASSVYDMYLGSQTQRRPGRIHGNVSSSDYHYLLSYHQRCVIVIAERLHQVASCQIFIG